MFSGFRSRCTMPAWCALARPLAICVAISRVFLTGSGPVVHQLPQRPAVDQLHRQVRRGLRAADLEDRDDVGMVQRGRGPRLQREAREPFLIAEQLLRQDLQRDLAAEPRVQRAVDLAHSAGAQPVDDLKRAQHGAGPQRHARIGGRGGLSSDPRRNDGGDPAAGGIRRHTASPAPGRAQPRRKAPSFRGLTERNGRKWEPCHEWRQVSAREWFIYRSGEAAEQKTSAR